LNNLEYDKDPVTRVAETAAKFRAGLIPEGVSDEDAARWLNEYYKEVEAKHGPQSLDEANRINDIARQHVEDIYAAREAANRSADQEAGNNVLGGVQEGSRSPAGLGETKPQEGLSAKELVRKEPETLDEMGLSLVDKARVPGYEIELATAKDDPNWFELGFQQEGRDSSSVTQQHQKFPPKFIPFQQLKPILDSWLEKHPKIHVMSFNQDYLGKYARILKLAGYDVGKEPELVEGKEAYYISRPNNGLSSRELTGRYRAHEKGELFDYNRAKELFRAVLPPEIAKDAIGKLYSYTGGNKWVTQKELDWIADRAQRGLRGLQAREISPEENQDLVGFVSPNVHNIGSVADAQIRLGSRPQIITERLSNDFASALPGVRVVTRPAIGHWFGGAENSTIQRFAPGTDPDAVEYHNAFMSKAAYQNMGAGFIPGSGSDTLFQFRVPEGMADARTVGALLESHQIPGDTIEPVPGGNIVHVISKADNDLRPRVEEISNRLGIGKVTETNGRYFEHGDYSSRAVAQQVLESRLSALEAKHPEWRAVRQKFESSPDYVGLSKLVREADQPVEPHPFARAKNFPIIEATHGSGHSDLSEINPEKWGTNKRAPVGEEKLRRERFPEQWVDRSFFQLEGTNGERPYTSLPYQYRASLNAENLYDLAADPDGLFNKAKSEAERLSPKVRNFRGEDVSAVPPGLAFTIYEKMIHDSGYEGAYNPHSGVVEAFKNTPVESVLRSDASPENGLFSREHDELLSSLVDVQSKIRDREAAARKILSESKGDFAPAASVFKELSELYKQKDNAVNKYEASFPPRTPEEEPTFVRQEQPRTPEFQKFIKGTKVTDGKGNVLRAFHGTTKDFETFATTTDMMDKARATYAHPFNKTRTNPEWNGALGSWFTTESLHKGNYDPENAEYQAGAFAGEDSESTKTGAKTLPVWLSIKNPIEYDGYEDFQDHRDQFKSLSDFRNHLEKQGHDGVVIRNSMTDGNVDRDDWVAFEPGK
jgi:hypothetical protein